MKRSSKTRPERRFSDQSLAVPSLVDSTVCNITITVFGELEELTLCNNHAINAQCAFNIHLSSNPVTCKIDNDYNNNSSGISHMMISRMV